MPMGWSTGGTVSSAYTVQNSLRLMCLLNQLGPIIGGSLSRPAERFPSLFGNNEFLKKYPYFLPCAVPATYSALAWLLAFLFLKETAPSHVSFSRLFKFRNDKPNPVQQKVAGSQEPTMAPDPKLADIEQPLPLRSLLTRRVIIAAGNYAFLSLVDIAFRAIQPLFFSTPIELGGLGMPPATIGKILSAFGVLNGTFQILFFSRIHDYWGSKKVFTVGMASAFPVFAAFPLMNYLARIHGLNTTVWVIVAFQVVISIGLSLSYGKHTLTPLILFHAQLSIYRSHFHIHSRCFAESGIPGSDKRVESGTSSFIMAVSALR